MLTSQEKAVLRCILEVDHGCKSCPFDVTEDNTCGLFESWQTHKASMLDKLREKGLV